MNLYPYSLFQKCLRKSENSEGENKCLLFSIKNLLIYINSSIKSDVCIKFFVTILLLLSSLKDYISRFGYRQVLSFGLEPVLVGDVVYIEEFSVFLVFV